MSVTEILIKVVGAALVVLGLVAICSSLGLQLGVGLSFINPIFLFIIGIVLIGFGIYIIRGGRPTV
jgi:hypothetical protein